MKKPCPVCGDEHEYGDLCPVLAKVRIKTPYDRQAEADSWLLETVKGDYERMAKAIEIMITYHRMGGRRTIFPAGLRVLAYDKRADRERQRLARLKRKIV